MDVVYDIDQINELAQMCRNELELSQKVMNRFLEIMDKVNSQALIKGAAHDAFVLETNYMRISFNNTVDFEAVGRNIQAIATSFIEQINNNADKFEIGAAEDTPIYGSGHGSGGGGVSSW